MTEELKAKLSKAKSEEEVKKILEENKAELTKEELEAVSGGRYRVGGPNIHIIVNDWKSDITSNVTKVD